MNIIKAIFYGRELTIERDDNGELVCTLDKWSTREPIVINSSIIKRLLAFDFIISDRGNFETGEQHYIYNNSKDKYIHQYKFDELKIILRKINLNKLIVT